MPLRPPSLLCLLLPFAAATATAADAPPCPALPAPVAELACVANEAGWFYAHDAESAAGIAEDALRAGEDFRRHFSRPPPRGAVIARGTGAAASPEAAQRLRDAGAAWHLPWLDASERRELQRSGIERQLRAQRPQASDAEVAALLETALARAPSPQATDRSALRHEIGHVLLIHAFWPDAARTDDGATHYGGPAQDWLDETAAVLMESEDMADRRRERLAEPGERARLLPLDAFFAAAHPLAARLTELRPSAAGGGIRVISGEDAQRLSAEAGGFYAQARGVADFLIETGGDPAVFGDIAAFAADGGDMAGWLSAHGARYGLPATVTALDAAWQHWLDARAGATASDDARNTGADLLDLRWPDGRALRLAPYRIDAARGLSTARCGVEIAGRRVDTIGVGEAEAYTCNALVEAGPLPPDADGHRRIGLIYDVSSPNAAFRTAIVLVDAAGAWAVDPETPARFDDTPQARSIDALAAALRTPRR